MAKSVDAPYKVALDHFVEVDRFADLLARGCGFPNRCWASSATVYRRIEQYCSVTLGVIPPKFLLPPRRSNI